MDGMVKLIFSSAFDTTVDVGMRLVEDPRQLTKSASTIFGCDYTELMPDKDHLGIHLTALGDFEHYGLNRNADGFPKKACIGYHQTFVKNGNLYRHHRNKDPEARLGQIVKSAYNDPMGRIELFIHAHKEKARDELQKLATDGDLPFSMACVKAGTLIVTSTGVKKIEDIQPGEKVLTHTGNWGIVGNRSVRDASNYLKIQFASWGRTTLEITGNHEVLAASFYDISKGSHPNSASPLSKLFKRAHRHELHKYAKYIPAEQLTDDHYMLVPIDRLESETVLVPWARVLGYYIAEGSFGQGMTTFTCGVDDVAVTELSTLAPWTSIIVRPRSNSDKAVDVQCFGAELRNKIEDLCGRRGENKHVPMLIQHADADAKLNFMAAWFNGDGWQDKNGLHWSTHYQGLAIDLQRLLASVDVPSSCERIDHPVDRGIVQSEDAVEYVVNVSNQHCDLFADISKAGMLDIIGATKMRTFISGGYLCIPIKSIEKVVETVPVYNFSVEGSESYTVYGLAVHNCKVAFDRCTACNTLRKSSQDPKQCDHVLLNLGKMSEDGSVIGTQNDEPNWFDISFVTRPADRIAWYLKAASGEIIDSVKLAEAEGIWVPDRMVIVSQDAQDKLNLLKKLAEAERHYQNLVDHKPATVSEWYTWELRKAANASLDDVTLLAMRNSDPADVFYKLAKNGVLLDVASFYKYVFGMDKTAELAVDFAEVQKRVSGIYTRLEKEGHCQTVCTERMFDVDTNRYCSAVEGLTVKTAEAVTMVGPAMEQRIIDATLNNVEIGVDTKTEISSNSNLTIDVLAEKYAAYKIAAVKAMLSFSKNTDTDALVAIAAVQNLVRV